MAQNLYVSIVILSLITFTLAQYATENSNTDGEYEASKAELEALFKKADPNNDGKLEIVDYQELLKDLIFGSDRPESKNNKKDNEEIAIDNDINAIQRTLIGLLIDDFVKDEYPDGDITIEKVLQDLESEKLLDYIESHYRQKLEQKFNSDQDEL